MNKDFVILAPTASVNRKQTIACNNMGAHSCNLQPFNITPYVHTQTPSNCNLYLLKGIEIHLYKN